MNDLLGHGDSGKFNLLGGSFGDAGDVVMLTAGYGRRSVARAKKEGRRAYSSYIFVGGGMAAPRTRYRFVRPRTPTLTP